MVRPARGRAVGPGPVPRSFVTRGGSDWRIVVARGGNAGRAGSAGRMALASWVERRGDGMEVIRAEGTGCGPSTCLRGLGRLRGGGARCFGVHRPGGVRRRRPGCGRRPVPGRHLGGRRPAHGHCGPSRPAGDRRHLPGRRRAVLRRVQAVRHRQRARVVPVLRRRARRGRRRAGGVHGLAPTPTARIARPRACTSCP